ncbi:hypothetical protein FB451DRAFT_1284284 [Mycena latifolia]|nr:hypothetical protein FB451DRAFT_1284284 [Mycena latifolia]
MTAPSREDVLESLLQTEIVLFMHGMYIILVGLALWSLFRRKPAGYRVLSGLISAMCIFGTVEMVLQTVDTQILLRSLYTPGEAEGQVIHRTDKLLSFAENLLVVTNNAIADSLLIYRCYVIWGSSSSNKKVIVLPILLSLATAASGYLAAYQDFEIPGPPDPRIFFGLVVATNLTLTVLSAGRIFYTRRKLQRVGQTAIARRYTTAIKMLLESAVIYLILSLTIIVERALARFAVIDAFYAISAELMNIIPALLIVQISFGRKLAASPPIDKPEISSV